MNIRTGVLFACMALSLHAEIKTEMIQYKDGDTVLEGMIAYDDSSTAKRPGVVVVHEWWGLNDHSKNSAKKLAELGYVGFAADMYGKGVTTDDPAQAGKMSGALKGDRPTLRKRAQAALDTLAAFKYTDATRLGAIGYCFGGTTALEIARSGAPVKGIVSFHGALGTPTPADAKNIKCPVLVCHGAEDPFVPAAEVADFKKEMDAAKVKYTFIAYPGAVHSFTNPDVDRHKLNGAKYDKAATEKSWADMQAFFAQAFQ
ncbi:MAG: dienelactone hydrolase family protein [Candidatus Hydrogenedentes bacterium]|nr:dienelactone hydrolase family protein [Candidatus Hydrogenedentota bacterium]